MRVIPTEILDKNARERGHLFRSRESPFWFWAITAAVGVLGGALGYLGVSLCRRQCINPRRLRVIVSGSPEKATTEKLIFPQDLLLERKRDDAFDPRPREGYANALMEFPIAVHSCLNCIWP